MTNHEREEKIIIWKAINIDAVDDTDRFIDALIIEREALWKENARIKKTYEDPSCNLKKLWAVARSADALNEFDGEAKYCGELLGPLDEALAALKETE